MANEQGYFLSEGDVEWLKNRGDQQDKRRQQRPKQTPLPFYQWEGEIFLALVPCGECIPKRVGDVPGFRECCIFKMDARQFGSDIHDILPILALEDRPDSVLRDIVFNTGDEDACSWLSDGTHFNYLHIERERISGRFVVRNREAPPSTTTSTTGQGQGDVGDSGCKGNCEWDWDDSSQLWLLTTNGCSTTTTSSTTTTTPAGPTTSSTTTTSCACLPSTTTTTSGTSTSSTTTTTPSCVCLYPNFCGTDPVCEKTTTQCVPAGTVQPNPGCTSTTTTSTTSSTTTTGTGTSTSSTTTTTEDPCSTTTTTSADNCGTGCDWIYFPAQGWVPNGLHDCPHISEIVNGKICGDCPQPNPVGPGACDTAHTDCSQLGTTTSYPPACGGNCLWFCAPTTTTPPAGTTTTSAGTTTTGPEVGQWILVNDAPCSGGLMGPVTCYCDPPSSDCDPCGEETSTACTDHTSSTTSTTAWCSSTTTTTDGCAGTCKYRYEVPPSSWSVEEDNCAPQCPCTNGLPIGPGYDCEVRIYPCPNTTTSTTTTTSTSTTTTSTTTTSTSTSSTTTTTCAPCDPGLGDCVYVWHGGDDVSGWELVSDGCGNGFCESNTPPVPEAPPCTCGFLDGCGTTSTTTTSTATSTSTSTTDCPPPSFNNCMYKFVGGSWIEVGFNCDTGNGYGCGGEPGGGGSEGQCSETPCVQA